MSFWTQADSTPKRNFRFLVQITALGDNGDQSVIWWAKTAKTPSFSLAETTHAYLDNTFKFPGRVTWDDVNISLVDPVSPDATKLTMQVLEKSNYRVKGLGQNELTVSKAKAATALGNVVITILSDDGDAVETWTLNNPFIKSVSFSDLSYEDDGLRSIDLTMAYDWATCETADGTAFNGKPGAT